jgi:hypothetical protein
MDYSALNYKKDNKKNTNSALGDVEWFNNKENWTFNIEPNISGGTYSSGQDVRLPDQTVRITDEGFGAGGNVDFNVGTPSGYGFGGGVEGQYNRGTVNFPNELQQYGAPNNINYGEGLDITGYNANVTTPSGARFGGSYYPQEGRDAWMLNYNTPVDLSKILRNVR